MTTESRNRKVKNENTTVFWTGVSLAMLALLLNASPAFAVINNEVTVTGTAPNSAPVTDTDQEDVDVIDDNPALTVAKVASFAPGGDVDNDGRADAGDVITYTYTITNSGNVTLLDVTVTDTEDGAGNLSPLVIPAAVTTDNPGPNPLAGMVGDSSDTTTGDADWDILGPGDVVTFTSTYTVLAADIANASGNGDGDIDNSAVASGAYDPTSGPAVPVNSAPSTQTVPLDLNPQMVVTKTASPNTNVAAGTTVTYTYTIENTGSSPISNVTLAETNFTGSGTLSTPIFSSWTTQNASIVNGTNDGLTLLNPGAIAVFTATYVVTQADVDNNQ